MTKKEEISVMEVLQFLKEHMATKEDLEEIRTDLSSVKSQLKNFATKEDLKAVRNDLRAFATKEDLKAVRNDLKAFATKEDLKLGLDDLKKELRQDMKEMEIRLTERLDFIAKEHREDRKEVAKIDYRLTKLEATSGVKV